MGKKEVLAKYRERYESALHSMQTGVAMLMNYDGKETSPKHLRVGVNSALIDSAALAKILIDKGIITEEEYYASLADFAEADAASYQEKLQGMFPNTNITLG